MPTALSGWNKAGIWTGESVRATFRPEKARPFMLAEFEVAQTPEGWGWAHRYFTVEAGQSSEILRAEVLPTRDEALSAAIDGLGSALLRSRDYTRNGAERRRLEKMLEWLAREADKLAPAQASLFADQVGGDDRVSSGEQ